MSLMAWIVPRKATLTSITIGSSCSAHTDAPCTIARLLVPSHRTADCGMLRG